MFTYNYLYNKSPSKNLKMIVIVLEEDIDQPQKTFLLV